MEGHQQGGGWERMGEKAQVIRSINGRYEIDRRRLRVVWEMEKPKTHARPMHMNEVWGMMVGGECKVERNKWDNCNSTMNKIHLKNK